MARIRTKEEKNIWCSCFLFCFFTLTITKPPSAASPSLLKLSWQLKMQRVVVRWHLTGDRWQVDGWHVTGERWKVEGDRWQVTSDRWQMTHNLILTHVGFFFFYLGLIYLFFFIIKILVKYLFLFVRLLFSFTPFKLSSSYFSMGWCCDQQLHRTSRGRTQELALDLKLPLPILQNFTTSLARHWVLLLSMRIYIFLAGALRTSPSRV